MKGDKSNARAGKGPYRFLASPLIVILLAFGVGRVVYAYTWDTVTTSGQHSNPYARARAVHENADTIAEQGSAIALGVCFTEYGLIPKVFDEEMAANGIETTTFNLAHFSITAETERAIGRRALRAFEARGKRPKLMLVELSVSMSTTDAEYEGPMGTPGYQTKLRSLVRLDLAGTGRLLRADPFAGLGQVGSTLLGGNAETFTAETACYLGTSTHWACGGNEPGWWPYTKSNPGVEKEKKNYQSLKEKTIAKYGSAQGLAWSLEERGHVRWTDPETASEYQVAQGLHDRGVYGTRTGFARFANMNTCEDPERTVGCKPRRGDGPRMDTYVSMLKEFKERSDELIVFITPKSHKTRELVDNRVSDFYHQAAERIQKEVGVEVIWLLEHPDGYTIDDFRSRSYALLSEQSGAPRFSKHLAQKVAQIMSEKALDRQAARTADR